MKVTLVDYGAGNVTSVARALRQAGAEPVAAAGPSGINSAAALVLPGVGHYGALIRALDERNLRRPLLAAIARGVPFLGICLGLQALYESSEEAPDLAGLGVLPGRVAALPHCLKLPHMGWNRVTARASSPLFAGISPDAYFYFAHSYVAPRSPDASAECSYGANFTAAAESGRIFGVQFHPEKSAAPGAQLLANFLRLAA